MAPKAAGCQWGSRAAPGSRNLRQTDPGAPMRLSWNEIRTRAASGIHTDSRIC